MLDADATCCCKSSATFRVAHFLVAVTAVLVAIFFFGRLGSCNAVAKRAEPKGAMWTAESTSESSCTTPSSRTDFLVASMCVAKATCYSDVAATFSRADHFVSGMLEADLLSLVCVGDAPIRCADTMRAMFSADACTWKARSLAAWMVAEPSDSAV